MFNSIDNGRQARVAKALVETSRDTFANQLVLAGFDLPYDECARIFDEDPAIRRKVTADKDNRVFGVQDAIDHVRSKFPAMFNSLAIQDQEAQAALSSDAPMKSREDIARDIYRSMSGQNPQQASKVQTRTAFRGFETRLSKIRKSM